MSELGDRALIKAAATANGINPQTLYGVWSVESNKGENNGPSSAGAVGPFQFMPATSKSLGCDPNKFESAAFCAAKYLRQLGANSKVDSPATINALNKYNGNGGGTSMTSYATKVIEEGKGYGGAIGPDLPGVPDLVPDIGNPLGTVNDVAGAVGDVAGALLNPSTYLRIGKGLLGGGLLIFGVAGLVFVVASKSNTGKQIASTVVSKVPGV